MTIKTKPTPKKLFQLAQSLRPAEKRWLRDALNRIVEQEPLPTAELDARKMLQASFGMWAERDDTPVDGVDYVNQIRRSTRWDDLGLVADEID